MNKLIFSCSLIIFLLFLLLIFPIKVCIFNNLKKLYNIPIKTFLLQIIKHLAVRKPIIPARIIPGFRQPIL